MEHLSQPYGLEIFLKRPIEVLLSVAQLNPPLVLPGTESINQAVHTALQRPTVQLYEPIVVQEGTHTWSLLDFQVLLLAQTQILSLQKQELAEQSQQIVALNDRLTWQANHDSLTQLLNRRAFKRYIQEAIEDARINRSQHILCCLDLDRFKVVNDTCGHGAGDELLRQVAVLLQNGIRKSDLACRLGGDEFALLLRYCELEIGVRVANTLRQTLEDLRFLWKENIFRIGCSMGLTVIDCSTQDLNQVLNAGDSACYIAKNRGGNRVYVYQPNDEELLLQQTALHSVTELQRALDESRLRLYAQPLVKLSKPHWTLGLEGNPTSMVAHPFEEEDLWHDPIVGYEILLRIADPKGEILLPTPFILAAERYKLMPLVDRWVIENLFAFSQTTDVQTLSKQDKSLPVVSESLYMINLSGESIKDEKFPEFVRHQIAIYNVPTHLICFEITETVAITNFSQAARCIRELRSLGFLFALDDFGSGMSSFIYLKHLQVDYLKIDSSFVQEMDKDPISLAIIKAICEVGQSIGLKIIAEGVETLKVLEQLRDLGIDYAQGYKIAHPQPLVQNNSDEKMIRPYPSSARKFLSS